MRSWKNATLLMVSMGLISMVALAEDAKSTKAEAPKLVYDFTMKDIDGKDVNLSKYKGNVVMIVNVASECGLTEHSYTGLNTIYEKYHDKGFQILAFPANNFGSQEPGSDSEIKGFCSAKKVAFDLFSKISVKGDDQHPLYKYLTKHPDPAIAGDVQWNFQKYLIGRDGKVIAKFAPKTWPEDKSVTEAIEKAIASK